MKPEDWPVGATFTYNSPYGPSTWIGLVKESHFSLNGELDAITSTKGTHYPIICITIETKEEFTSRIRESRFGELGI